VAGVLLCEDGGGVEDAFGLGERLMGLTPAGETYLFAKNNVQLSPSTSRRRASRPEFVREGDYRETEFAGATFDPSGKWLFVNVSRRGSPSRSPGRGRRGLL
jgi:hypothetical protein